MCRDNEDRDTGFMKDPFAYATHDKLIHRASSMRAYNNHVCTHVRGLLENCFYSCAMHEKGRCFHA